MQTLLAFAAVFGVVFIVYRVARSGRSSTKRRDLPKDGRHGDRVEP